MVPNSKLQQLGSVEGLVMETSRQRYFDFEFEFVFFILLSPVNFLLFSNLVFLFLVSHRLCGENSIVISLFKGFIVLNKK